MSKVVSKVMSKEEIKVFIYNILNGLGMGVIFALIPGVLIGEIMRTFIDTFPYANEILAITTISTRIMPAIIGVCVAMQFKFSPMATVSIGSATMIASGVAIFNPDNTFTLAGTGDVINSLITATIGVIVVKILNTKFRSFQVIILPITVILVAGGIGTLLLPYVSLTTSYVGEVIVLFTTLQPTLMCILIAMSFSVIIVTPISTVGLALAIELAGVGAGAANLGVVASSFGLGIAGLKVNNLGIVISHFISSPKMQLANFARKPTIILPTLSIAAILGFISSFIGIKGTSLSAGFGLAGFIGPINAFNFMDHNTANKIIIISIMYFILPLILAFIFKFLYIDKLKIISADDYKINLD